VGFESQSTDPRQARLAATTAGQHEERRTARPWHVATGSLACPDCDAPVVLGGRSATPTDVLTCPFCDRAAALRDFLSLASPPRAPRVRVLVRA
jgi:hypothetical protein